MFIRRFVQALLVVSCVGMAWAETEGQIGTPKEPEPDIVGAGGEFTHRYDIKIPEFRGLPLPVSLSYNSSNTARGGVENTVGFGWKLNAFSMIERKSLGGGVPTFDDGQDLYVLDGQELMACDKLDGGAVASNPLGGYYPLRYLTDRSSASCLAGGNMTTRVESFRKIVFDKVANEFTVTRKDGTRYIYKTLGVLAGYTGTDAEELKVAQKTRWLLDRIEDVQVEANTVQYSYSFATRSRAWAPRLKSISYGNGYQVVFGYRTLISRGLPTPKYATGTTVIGEVNQQLRSIRILDGSTPIRAYQIFHANSALSKAQLVTKIAEYGNNYVLTGSDITGGSVLSQEKFDYSADTVGFWEANATNTPSLSGIQLHSGNKVLDWNRDGSDEIWLSGTEGGWQKGGMYSFDTNRVLTTEVAPEFGCFGKRLVTGETVVIEKFIADDRSASSRYCITIKQNKKQSGDEDKWDFLASLGPFGSSSSTPTSTLWQGYTQFESRTLLWNMDFDPEPELYWDSGISKGFYQIEDGGKFSARQASGNLFVSGSVTYRSDFTGDSIPDFFASYYYHRFLPEQGYFESNLRTAATTTWKNVRGLINPTGKFLGYGDINTDGLVDLVFLVGGKSSAEKLEVFFSYGAGFMSKQTIELGEVVGEDLLFSGTQMGLRDLNGDGLVDLMVYGGSVGTSGNYRAAKTWLFANTGDGFAPVTLYGGTTGVSGFVGHGDFDGNGRVDFIKEGEQGKIVFGEGPLPNRMTRVTTGMGGKIDIEYTSSAEFGVNEAPGVQLVVKSLTRDDGLGNTAKTTFSYVGGAYDFVNRRTLGYRTVTANLPALAGEAVGPRVVTTYMNDHLAEYGRVKSRLVIEGTATSTLTPELTASPVTHQRDIYDYSYNFDKAAPGYGPYRVDLAQARKAVLYSDKLVETTKQWWYDDYGSLLTERDLGFTSNGADLDVSDNSQKSTYYAKNLGTYIVNTVAVARQLSTFVDPLDFNATQDRSIWIWAITNKYDGHGQYLAPPTIGNLSTKMVWAGDLSGWSTAAISSFTYDSHGNVMTEKDPRGAVTSHTYDPDKHLFRISTTNALGQVSLASWSYACQSPVTQTDLNGRVTQFTYDQHCRETRVTKPDGNYVETSYFNFGDPTLQRIRQVTKSGSTATGQALSYSYSHFDGFGREYLQRAPGELSNAESPNKVFKAYDARGNLAWQSIPLPGSATTVSSSQKVTFHYDLLNRVTKQIHPDGAFNETRYEYFGEDPIGGVTMDYTGPVQGNFPTVMHSNEDCSDGNSATTCIRTFESFDAAGRRIRLFRDNSTITGGARSGIGIPVTFFEYTPEGHLKRVVDPLGAVYAYEYDSFGNRVRTDDPGLGVWTMTYDLNGNLETQTDAKGQRIEFSYDLLNRVTRKRVKTASGAITDTNMVYGTSKGGYYNIGELVSAANPDHTVTYDYHVTGQVARERHTVGGRNFEFQTTFTAAGQVKDRFLPQTRSSNGWIGTHQYDAAGRLTSIVRAADSRTLVQSITYDVAGRPLEAIYGNGARDKTAYNTQRGWINKIETFEGSGTKARILDTSYVRSASGRVASQHNEYSSGRLAYSYDYAGRLLSATNTAGLQDYSQTFQYDAAGRMRYNSRVGTYAYSGTTPDHAPWQITDTNGATQTFSYDANGNMLGGLQNKIMTYDAENRPVSVKNGGVTITYVYGADGTRLKKIEGTEQTLYLGPVEIRKFGQGTAEEVISYPLPNLRLTDGALSVLHMDQLNSIRGATGPDGSKDERTTYRPFGEPTERDHDAAAADETKRFIGERYDADAGLMYLNARYYDPKLGLFIQPDWFEVTESGVGTNRYSYSLNDPVNRLDPLGNKSKLAEFFDRVGDWLKNDAASTGVRGINSVEAARARGVEDAWKMEQQMVRRTGIGTRAWSDAELELLRQGKKVPGYVGDHITTVSADLTKAADHRNIQFLTKKEHSARHRAHGGTRTPISEDRIVDRTLGGSLPDLATDGAKSWKERTGRALSAISNSRTLMVIDLLDPVSIVDKYYMQKTGYGVLDYFMMSPVERACVSNPRCI